MADPCPICLSDDAQVDFDPTGADAVVVGCRRCGQFWISRTLATQLGRHFEDEDVAYHYEPRWILSGAIRNRYVRGGELELTTQTVEDLLDVAQRPKDPLESINLLLRHLRRKATSPSELIGIFPGLDEPLVYARNPEDLRYYLSKAEGLDLIESGSAAHHYRLGLEGWRRLRELDERRADSNQAFVAMWFDEEMTDAYAGGFEPALETTGYDPLRIDMKEHNEQIDNKIIAEIRQSGLLVADFTGQREGVYFEAGFAKGLDIPVIWTCREDEYDHLHFDTRQYNHIGWSNPSDLREKLSNRIRATLP